MKTVNVVQKQPPWTLEAAGYEWCHAQCGWSRQSLSKKLQSVQNMAARMVSGVCRSEHIMPVLEDLHWLPVSQRVVYKTALMVWKCVHGVTPAYLSDLCVPATAISSRHHSPSAICSDWHSTGSMCPDCNWTTKFRSQRTSHTDPSATSTTVTGPVGERLQAGTEDAPVLDCPAPLRRFHDSGAGYKHPDLLTYRLVLETRNGDEPPLLYTEGGCQCYIPLHIENRTMQ